ncbi:type IV secretion system protein VirB2 [Anaplasma centrale str. Israel]|uniref:Type IV secretion system protein VirB2 n=1 Tax=Anaplasma centrale (strain Israel) TaxID=574556 RepID=D1AUH0_ANACI|nr:TrbC/VirB2 family protein [Anaplasma centrale]ACZ49198.1 type IV secretion system protein VirB2 [Anaplasma centrale str. Israel]
MLLKLRFLLIAGVLALGILHGVPAAGAETAGTEADDTATVVICNVIRFVQKLGLPIMTGVILGSSIMAIFGKLAWPAIVMLVVFTAIFFGAGKLMAKFAAGLSGDGIGDASKFDCSKHTAVKPGTGAARQ